MLKTLSDEDSFSYSKEVSFPHSNSLRKNDPVPNLAVSTFTKTMHRQVNSGDVYKSAKVYERTNSPHSALQYYPSLQYRALPQSKLTKFKRLADTKHQNSPYKKLPTEPFEAPEKVNKPVSSQNDFVSNQLDSQGSRKSLPFNNLVSKEQLLQSYFQHKRDNLKGKYQTRAEQHQQNQSRTITTPVQSFQQSSMKNTDKQSSRTIDETPKKSAQESEKVLKYHQTYFQEKEKRKSMIPQSSNSSDKILLLSSSKQSNGDISPMKTPVKDFQTAYQEEQKTLTDNSSREVMVTALKKSPNSSTQLTKKENVYIPIPKNMEKDDTMNGSSSTSKDIRRMGDVVQIPVSKVKQTHPSVSPLKKITRNERSAKEIKVERPPPQAAMNSEPRKSTVVPVYLSEEEKAQYGDRSLPDYEKKELLGKGGFALVWLGMSKETGKRVAMKQMIKSGGGGDSKKNDIYYGQLLFKEGGEPRDEFRKYPGIQHVASFVDFKSTKYDDWYITELCGKTLSSLCFDMKGEFYKGERVYGVKHLALHSRFKQDDFALKVFVKKMAEILDLFSNYYIVHCDIKPDNILINSDAGSTGQMNLKIIDFGSAYNWGDSGNLRMATPEYMPPEFLNFLIGRNATENSIEQLSEISNPWSVDVWSLGAILLEIITGIPLWIPLKCKLENGSKLSLRYGLFAVKGRAYDKIYQKQKALIDDLRETLGGYLQKWCDADLLFDLLSCMLRWDPKKRISPSAILKHPYLQGV